MGSVGKPKGALQVLYERGWINPAADPKEYTMKGKIDEFGNRDLKKSLTSMIAQQPDFMHEQTMLQHYCAKLGIRSDRTPVAHCKIAGEGIEFDWEFSKLTYRAKPISLKRNKSKFHSLVNSVLSREVLTLAVCQANVHRARQYMLAYMTLAASTSNQSQSTQNPITTTETQTTNKTNITTKHGTKENPITHSLIEKCVSLYRTRRLHRNVRDFDGKYINEIFVKEVVEKMSEFPKKEPSQNPK